MSGSDEDWKTIGALLRAGCSLPHDLQCIYDAHRRDIEEQYRSQAKRMTTREKRSMNPKDE